MLRILLKPADFIHDKIIKTNKIQVIFAISKKIIIINNNNVIFNDVRNDFTNNIQTIRFKRFFVDKTMSDDDTVAEQYNTKDK